MIQKERAFKFFGKVKSYLLIDTEKPYGMKADTGGGKRVPLNTVRVRRNEDGSTYIQQGSQGVVLTPEMYEDLKGVMIKIDENGKSKKR